jgi:hypothetical protein
MSTFDYLTPGEAVTAARSDAPAYMSIRGLLAADADWVTRTRSGQALKPEATWEARAYLGRFKKVVRVEWAQDADPGTIEVFYADGTSAYLHRIDLLCVERPIPTPTAVPAVVYEVPDVEPDPETGLSIWAYFANGKMIGRVEETERGYVPVRTDSLGVETQRFDEDTYRDDALDTIRRHYETTNGLAHS